MLKTHLELCYDPSARKDLEKLNSPHGMLVKRIPSKPVKDITVLWEQPQELLRRYTPSFWVFTNISIKLNLGLDLFIFPQPCFYCNHILIFWLDYIVELNYFQRPERDYGFFSLSWRTDCFTDTLFKVQSRNRHTSKNSSWTDFSFCPESNPGMCDITAKDMWKQ